MIEAITQYLSEKGGAACFGLLVLLKIGELVWNYAKERNKVTTDTLTAHTVALEKNTTQLITTQIDVKKLRVDMRHAFLALKEIAGNKWPVIAEKIEASNRLERERNRDREGTYGSES
jgi:hypothetical protein